MNRAELQRERDAAVAEAERLERLFEQYPKARLRSALETWARRINQIDVKLSALST